MTDGSTVEVYSPTTGGTIISTGTVGGYQKEVVSIGKSNIVGSITFSHQNNDFLLFTLSIFVKRHKPFQRQHKF